MRYIIFQIFYIIFTRPLCFLLKKFEEKKLMKNTPQLVFWRKVCDEKFLFKYILRQKHNIEKR